MDAKNSETLSDLDQPLQYARLVRGRAGQTGMSYKFQRLREKIRAAIASGELQGKLPGERALAKRFHVNAKTLSKALTDLAAEGVLDRSIGRGTYVKGSEPAAPTTGRWLVIGDADSVESPLVAALRLANPELLINTGTGDLRPSFLNQFAAVIDVAANTPDAFLRDLVVRNMPVVTVNREPRTYSTHAVLFDSQLNATRIGRDLVLAGHRRIAAIEPRGSTSLCVALRQALTRLDSEATVDAFCTEEAETAVRSGATAIVCYSPQSAETVRNTLDHASISVPHRVSLVALGCVGPSSVPCSGYFARTDEVADAVAGLLRDANISKPATLWLAGAWREAQTLTNVATSVTAQAAKMRIEGVLV